MIINTFLNKFSVPVVIDPQVKQYVVNIMNEKNAQLGKPAFTTIMIMKLQELFINVPNAMAAKNATSVKYLYLTSTTIDILEHLVFNEENQTYTLTFIGAKSPYTMKVTLTKRRAERMMRAIIEHELGHLYYDNHCRKYAPFVLLHASVGLCVAAFGMYKKLVAPLTVLPTLFGFPIDWSLVLISGGVYYMVFNLIQLTNSSWTDSSKWEAEADEFVAQDAEILRGGILFQEIALKAQTYIYSYSNWWIRLHAWWKGMDCAEFVRQNRQSAHNHFERSSILGEAYHPLHEDRIARFKERIGQIATENPVEIEPVTITIYKATQAVERFEV